MGAHGLRRGEPLRHIDTGLEGQGGDRPNTGNGHQAAARRVPAHDLQDHAVQTAEFRPESGTRLEHGLGCSTQAGTIGDECADPRREAFELRLE